MPPSIVRAADPEAPSIANPVNRGYAAAVNQAVAVADAEFVLLINPDVRERLRKLRRTCSNAFRDPRVGAVVARLLNSDGTLQPNCICAPRPFDLISEDLAFAERFPNWQRPRRYRMLDWDHREARPVDAARGACLFIRRAAIADVGLFDEHFFVYYEETDWLIRAKRRGWRTVFLPTVEAVHTSRRQLARRSLPTRSAASRKPASLRPKALRADDDRAPSRDTARNRHGTPRPPRAQPAEPTREPRRSTASASTSRCARPDPRSQMDVSYTSSLDGVEPADWRRLAERAGHVFATREWLLTWWRHYGKARRQLIGLARAGGDLVAIVPLYEWWRHGLPVLRFVGHGPSDQLGPICAPLSEPAAAVGGRRGHGAPFRCGASCCSPSRSPATSASGS